MSRMNIQGVVDNIPPTHPYLPLLEAVVNAFDAIDQARERYGMAERGVVRVRLVRSPQQRTLPQEGAGLEPISGFIIEDNGIGFDHQNRNSFDTLYSDMKVSQGGKGFGRFLFLKHFEHVRVESRYREAGQIKGRVFTFGRKRDIIIDESEVQVPSGESGTTLYLEDAYKAHYEKRLKTVAKRLLEKLLVFFINETYDCPLVYVEEADGSDEVCLNQFVSDPEASEIEVIDQGHFKMEALDADEVFLYKIVKILFPSKQTSKVSLVAHHREVTEVPLSEYINEFEGDFSEEITTKKGTPKKQNYIVRTYVLSYYFDKHVSRTRNTFAFGAHADMHFPIGQRDIEQKAAELTSQSFLQEVTTRREAKKQAYTKFVDEQAPWYRHYLDHLNYSQVPSRLKPEVMDVELHRAKYQQEQQAKQKMQQFIQGGHRFDEPETQQAFAELSKAKMSDLAHYVFLRRQTLQLLEQALQRDVQGNYPLEAALHSIIFPMGSNSETTPYQEHNLWIIDEKLNFTDFIASDEVLSAANRKRPDLLIFDRKMAFRSENEPSNPVTIFEFKRPQRDDFASPNAKDDPVRQVVTYVNDLLDEKYLTPKGRRLRVTLQTPFYGFIVCDVNQKVETWIQRFHSFKPLPDNQGLFRYFEGINLYIELISWDKLLKDANMRNRIFFHKLGID